MRDLLRKFAYLRPSQSKVMNVAKLRALFSQVDEELQQLCPSSRELSIALTKNEETAMWAIKAVVFNDPDSQAEQQPGGEEEHPGQQRK